MDVQPALKWKEQIKAWAKELGFVAVGFTGAEGHAGLAEVLRENERRGIATPFVSSTLAERSDPKTVWPECETVAAFAYPLPLSRPPQPGEGVMSRSAVGEDYHRVLRRKLERIVENMLEAGWPGSDVRIQVDTGPLNERAFAARAGVGWIGRNQQLIVPRYGSFVALGLLFLDQALPPDEPLEERCGECRRCVAACPAKILEAAPFEGKRCLSYLTQSKEELTPEQRLKLGNRIFGCDTCQEACPHNRERLQQEKLMLSDLVEAKVLITNGSEAGASYADGLGSSAPDEDDSGSLSLDRNELGSTAADASALREGLARGVDLLELLNLAGSGFKERFGHTAAGWRGKGILQRNALIALANIGDSRLQEWLAEKEGSGQKNISPLLSPYLPRKTEKT